MSGLRLRPAAAADLDVTSRLHCEHLPAGFFPRLGRRFLRAYHATFVDGPDARALVAERDGVVVGFVVGAIDPVAHARWTLRRRGPRLAAVGVLALAARPRVLALFLRTRVRRYGRAVLRQLRARHAPHPERPEAGAARPAVLLHVAVAAQARGAGAGAMLVDGFVGHARREGPTEVRLVTDVGGDAVAFYDRLGWERVRTRVASDGRRVVEYRVAA